jgi:phospholipase/carboxylesterase
MMFRMSRRSFSLAAAGLGMLSRSSAAAAAAEAPSPAPPRGGVLAGVSYVELVTGAGGASVPTEALPLILAIHGRGDSPENWARSWRSIPFAARIILPRGTIPYGGGFAWFEPPRAPGTPTPDELHKLVNDLTTSSDALARFASELQKSKDPTSRPIVTGFSQGGSLSFALAVRHGKEIAASFPIAGSLPAPLFPAPGTVVAPVTAFHGEDDARMPIAHARASVDAIRRAGAAAALRTYPGTGHEVSDAMWRDLLAAIAERPHAANVKPK